MAFEQSRCSQKHPVSSNFNNKIHHSVNTVFRLILPEPATCLALSPQNTYLAVGVNTKLFIWQLASGKLLSVQQKHFQPTTNIKFSSDGKIILVGGQDGMLVSYLVADIVSIVTNFMDQSELGQVEPLYVKNDHSMPIRDIHIGKEIITPVSRLQLKYQKLFNV